MKRWWNRRFPYYRLCGHRWCLRVMTYDYRCHLHQGDNRVGANVKVFDMAGNEVEPTATHLAQAHVLGSCCEHGVGMLDQCDDCCPPDRVAS